MFDRLFTRPAAQARQRAAPFAEERRAYLIRLADQGASRKSLRLAANYLLVVIDALRLADRPREDITLAEVRDHATRWAGRRPRPRNWAGGRAAQAAFLGEATRWLQFLGRLESPPVPVSPHAGIVAGFADHMRHHKGLSPQTVRGRLWFVRLFLNRLGPPDGPGREITAARIDDTFQGMTGSGGYSRVTIRVFANHLRAFLAYAETCGWCRRGLAAAVQGPRLFAHATLPAGPSWADVRRLLATTDGDRPADVRDRAILLLLAVYGLRAGEVTRLRLEDFDWDAERLTVTGLKTRRRRTYPLGRPVGDAVLRYLREVRPRSAHREVFLSLRAPVRPLRQLWPVVGLRLRPLGLSLPHHGPHALRHACATHLLAHGLSLKEIGDHLGHTDPDTTRIYAKVDLAGLRLVAEFDLGGLE